MTISPSLKPHWPKRTTDERSTECDDKELTDEKPLYILDIIDAPAKLALLTCVVDADLIPIQLNDRPPYCIDSNVNSHTMPSSVLYTSNIHVHCLHEFVVAIGTV